jgi:hypothetical protein
VFFTTFSGFGVFVQVEWKKNKKSFEVIFFVYSTQCMLFLHHSDLLSVTSPQAEILDTNGTLKQCS